MDTYWRCAVCEKTVELNLDGEQSRCAECGSPRVKLILPALKVDWPLPQDTAKRLFARLREALNF